MLIEGQQSDVKQRRMSFGTIGMLADRLYGTREDYAKLSLEEFLFKTNFQYGVPMVVLDFMYNVTGHSLVTRLHKLVHPVHLADRLDSTD